MGGGQQYKWGWRKEGYSPRELQVYIFPPEDYWSKAVAVGRKEPNQVKVFQETEETER